MPKLHLVAITPDHKGLVLSEHAGSKRGDLVLEIDDRLLDAIEKAQRLRARDDAGQLESAALPSKRLRSAGDDSPGVRLSVREIQQRIRGGETVAGLARAAGVDEEWVARFAPPVLAEIETMVDKAKAATFAKPRVGPSTLPLATSVAANVLEKGAELSVEEIDDAWTAFVRPDGGWSVTFTFPLKGRKQKAEWGFEPDTGEVTSRNKLAAELGYREAAGRGGAAAPPKPAAKPKAAAAPTEEETVEAIVEDALDDGAQTLPGTDVGPELSDTDAVPAFTRRPPTARKAPPRKAASGKPREMGGRPGPFGPPPGFEPEVADADTDDYGAEPEIADEDDGIPVLSPEEFLQDEPEPPAGEEPPFPEFPAAAAPLEATPESVMPPKAEDDEGS